VVKPVHCLSHGRAKKFVNNEENLRFGVFTAVTMKNAAFWDMTTPRDSCRNRSFGGIYRPHLQDDRLSYGWPTLSPR
jgi:hypothetical protein